MEKAKGLGGWVESGSKGDEIAAPLRRWMPPADWNVGAHAKHLRNLYVHFWRWATWKVFGDGGRGRVEGHAPDRIGDGDPPRTEGRAPDHRGIISFFTVAGFLNGPDFQKMRGELRRDADEIRVIDCSPEGHQPEVSACIVQGVQQPVYFAAVAAHPAYTVCFRSDLVQPRLRLPVTADATLFAEAAEIGREVIWLHCFGERFADPDAGRPGGPPRLPDGERPFIPTEGAIPIRPDRFTG